MTNFSKTNMENCLGKTFLVLLETSGSPCVVGSGALIEWQVLTEVQDLAGGIRLCRENSMLWTLYS